MKKIGIALSIILALGTFMGVGIWIGTKVKETQTPNIEIVESDEPYKDEILNENEEEEELVKKYWLSDNYTWDPYKDSIGSTWNLIDADGLVANSFEFESDGMTQKIEFVHKEKITNSWKEYNTYYLKINGETPVYDQIKVVAEDGYTNFAAIVDFDETDTYKELIVQENVGLWGSIFIYRVKKDGLEQIICFNDISERLEKVNDKLIIPVYNHNVLQDYKYVVEGYYTYENGEFKYIDRFLTGEKITDGNGNYTENFRNQVFEAQEGDSSIHCNVKYKGEIERVAGKVKLIKKVLYTDSNGLKDVYYHCEAVSDLQVYRIDEPVKISAGTIIAE